MKSDIHSGETSGPSYISYSRGPEPQQPIASSSGLKVRYSPNDDSVQALRHLIHGEYEYSASQKEPGQFLAIDCEMVGVGPNGKESVLARVSIVNYHGAVQMDEYVRPKERVVDYRTEFSGIRPKDLANARSFDEIQKQVADLIKDRILVGHAIHNDLKALLLSHPRSLVRDTQLLASRHKLTNSKRPALRNLVQQDFRVAIQSGEHSSVVDARATMAIYRRHRKVWETKRSATHSAPSKEAGSKRNRSASHADGEEFQLSPSDLAITDDANEPSAGQRTKETTHVKQNTKTPSKMAEYPGGGRKGVSSGLSTVVKRTESKAGKSWWTELGGVQKSS